MRTAKHPLLWLLLASWLLLAQAWAVNHSQEHGGLDDQHHCILCHIAQHGAKGLSHASPLVPLAIQFSPSGHWQAIPTRRLFLPSQQARGPPLF